MDFVFTCNACGFKLTAIVSGNPVELDVADGHDLVPQGFTSKSEDWGGDEWVVNAADADALKLTDDSKRLSGCCDLDGCDGPNLRCPSCSEYVATARFDCWMPKHIRMLQAATTMQSIASKEK